MNYDVVWNPSAENDIAEVWLASTDRGTVTAAVRWFDLSLASRPLSVGRPQTSSIQRVAVFGPVGIEFEVIEDDKRVVVLGAFAAGEI